MLCAVCTVCAVCALCTVCTVCTVCGVLLMDESSLVFCCRVSPIGVRETSTSLSRPAVSLVGRT